MPVKPSKKSVESIKVEKDEFLIEGEKSAMTTIRRWPLADCSKLKLRQLEKHGCQQ